MSEKFMKKIIHLIFALLLFASFANAQKADVQISLNEQFFDALLDAIFTNLKEPSFPLAESNPKSEVQSPKSAALQFQKVNFDESKDQRSKIKDQRPPCDESIRLKRSVDGVKTAVRFRNGKIYAPIAFAGSYNPPLIGCVDFSGYAETTIDVAFDGQNQRLIGRARVLNVKLSGTGGVGSSFVTRLVQSSIDNKINPIEILKADKLAFTIPIEKSGELRMKATRIRHEVAERVLSVYITFEFSKAR